MIGGWQLYIKYPEKVMYGRQNAGSQIAEEYIIVMIAGIISERNALLKSVMNIYTAGNKKERIRRMTSLLFYPIRIVIY